MAEEKHVTFGQSGWGTVWSVDDAWFEGYDRAPPIAEEISLFDPGQDYEAVLSAIADRVQARSIFGRIELKTELDYLEVLARLCKENDLYLKLCNFEYFEKNYHEEINREKTAILLDIRYDDFGRSDKKSALTGEPYTSTNYGYLLLGDMMNGERPRADIFFVTSRPELSDELKSIQKSAPLWWPMRTIPFVRKFSIEMAGEKALENELSLFIRYFRQGVEKDPRTEFSNALLRAQSFSHPDPDIKTVVPNGFLLKEEFVGVGESEDECESFKALYILNETSDGRGGRDLLARIFSGHLDHAGVKVEIDGAETFRLPVEPGMLFILCLIDLHRSLHLGQNPIRFEIQIQGDGGKVRMTIQLNDPRDFSEVFLTRDSAEGAVNALRRLIGCNTRVFEEWVSVDSDEKKSLIKNMKKGRLTKSERHFKPAMKHAFDPELTIEWEFDLSSPKTSFSKK